MARLQEEQRHGVDGGTKRKKRKDGALESSLGHAENMPGSGADLASTDMEVLEPSARRKDTFSDNTPRSQDH